MHTTLIEISMQGGNLTVATTKYPSMTAGATHGAFDDERLGDMRTDGAGRAFDIAIALIALVILSPVLLVVALAVFLTDAKGPIIFAHRRIGRDGVEFPCLKFRSMVVNAQDRLEHLLATDANARAEWAHSHKLQSDPRITPIGRFLRKSSLDELPQVFNVLMGHMSMVGPRPIIQAEVPRYGRYFTHYCAQRPGITGLWQISGRSNTDYRRRVAIDVAYSRSKSLMLDLRIIVMTVPAVLLAKGSC